MLKEHLLALTIPGEYGGSSNIIMPNAVNCGSNGCFNTVMQYITQWMFAFAVIICLAYLIWGGIDWTMSSGDKTKLQKARLKLIYAIIGLVIVFLAFFFVNLGGHLLGLPLTNVSTQVNIAPTQVNIAPTR